MDCVFHRHLRCITKPFKRWAFAMGVAYTLEHSLAYGNKYLLKYVRKRRKMASQMALLLHAHRCACRKPARITR